MRLVSVVLALLFLSACSRNNSLDTRVAKWRVLQMPFDQSALSARERQLVQKLVDANRYLDDIFWRQSDPGGLALYKTTHDEKVRRLLMINGGRFDLLDDNKPFVGNEPMPPGRALYPKGLTQAQIEQYVKMHPEKKAEIYDPYTVVQWRGKDLVGVSYHETWRKFLQPASTLLVEAAELSDDAEFSKFLRLRAGALLTDDYYASDLAWVDLKNPKFDVIFAPYETYLDDMLGVKTSYGGAVLVRDERASQELAIYEKYVPEIQDALPVAPRDRPSKHGFASPMEVMDAPYRAGDLRHGYQAVADNLPNDPRIHAKKGSKKIFFKNFMDARVNYIILPLAKRLMREDQAAKVSAQGYMAGTILHEISHGLGPAYTYQGGKQVDIREAIGPVYSGLEEAKADVVGMFGLQWLMDRGALPKERLEEYYASYVAGLLRTLRFGPGEAHGRAEMMEYNYLLEQKAISDRRVIDYTRMPKALGTLARELLEMEATGDRVRAEAWFKRYDKMPAELQSALASVKDLPVDIDPVFSFPDIVR